MYASQLQNSNQPVHQTISILIENARRKLDKKNNRKMANRKSASFCRARKKAHIDGILQENARLKRDSLILSHIPDPVSTTHCMNDITLSFYFKDLMFLLLVKYTKVVAIGTDGEIFFCSKQMERVIQHNANDLMGANIEELVMPECMDDIRIMVQDVIDAEKQIVSNFEDNGDSSDNIGNDDNNGKQDKGGNNSSGSDPNVISIRTSEQSFPMLEVNVDTSPNKDKATQQNSSIEAESLEDKDKDHPTKKAKKNVDDVMGAPVTANNADAKLSSLHYFQSDTKTSDRDLKPTSEMLRKQQQNETRQSVLAARKSSSSLTEKQEYLSSSLSDSLSKTKGQLSNSSDSGGRESNGNDIQEDSNESSSSSDDKEGTPLQKEGKSCFSIYKHTFYHENECFLM